MCKIRIWRRDPKNWELWKQRNGCTVNECGLTSTIKMNRTVSPRNFKCCRVADVLKCLWESWVTSSLTWTLDSCLFDTVIAGPAVFSQHALWERALSTAAADLIASAFFALTEGPWGLDRISTVHLSAHHCSFIHSPVNIICCCPLVTMVELHPAWALVSPINESNGSWKTREREIPTSRSVLGTIERIIWLILWAWFTIELSI